MIYKIDTLIEKLNTARDNGQETVMITSMFDGDIRSEFDASIEDNFIVENVDEAYQDFIDEYADFITIENMVMFIDQFLNDNFSKESE